MTRTRLPNRRGSETFAFEHEGIAYRATVSRIDGAIAELFLDAGKAGTGINIAARDLAVAASLAFQYGCPAAVLADALDKLPNGEPAGPLGVAIKMAGEPA